MSALGLPRDIIIKIVEYLNPWEARCFAAMIPDETWTDVCIERYLKYPERCTIRYYDGKNDDYELILDFERRMLSISFASIYDSVGPMDSQIYIVESFYNIDGVIVNGDSITAMYFDSVHCMGSEAHIVYWIKKKRCDLRAWAHEMISDLEYVFTPTIEEINVCDLDDGSIDESTDESVEYNGSIESNDTTESTEDTESSDDIYSSDDPSDDPIVDSSDDPIVDPIEHLLVRSAVYLPK